MEESKKTTSPEAAVAATKVTKKKPGPRPPVWEDLTSVLAQIKTMTPAERQAARTARGEMLVDAWMIRATERLMSDKVRSQDLVAVAGFLKANQFVVEPSKAGKPDALDRLMREKKEAAAEEARRLRNIEREKAKREAAATAFYAKQNGEPITPRLNTGDPGGIGITEGELSNGE